MHLISFCVLGFTRIIIYSISILSLQTKIEKTSQLQNTLRNYEDPTKRRRRFKLLLDILFDISNISSRRDPSVERFVVFISAAEDLSKVASSDILFLYFFCLVCGGDPSGEICCLHLWSGRFVVLSPPIFFLIFLVVCRDANWRYFYISGAEDLSKAVSSSL